MIFDSDFFDFIRILNDRKAKFVLVGGLAVVIHGHFRTTKDMDIFYEEENLLLKVIHINHLIANKTKVGRLQDLDDVKKLKKIIEIRKK